MMTLLKIIADWFVGKSNKGNPNTADAEFLRNYVLANKRGSEDDVLMFEHDDRQKAYFGLNEGAARVSGTEQVLHGKRVCA